MENGWIVWKILDFGRSILGLASSATGNDTKKAADPKLEGESPIKAINDDDANKKEPMAQTAVLQNAMDRLRAAMARVQTGNPVDMVLEPDPDNGRGALYLGSMKASLDLALLRSLGITHVVQALDTTMTLFEKQGIQYHRVSIVDSATVNLTQHIASANAFIGRELAAGNNVLVHCFAVSTLVPFNWILLGACVDI